MASNAAVDRVLAKVERIPFSGCWIFMGCVNRYGYGRIGIGHDRVELAHRVTYAHHVGGIAEGLNVLHRCDVPACVNPAHLFAGDQMANVRDMREKGRHSNPPLHYGEQQHCAVLTEPQVVEIRRRRANGETGVALARAFDVSPSTISLIHKRKKWKHL